MCDGHNRKGVARPGSRCPGRSRRRRMNDSVITVQNFRKVYGKVVAVADISFDVRRGEIFGLLGPNGAGKTTTLECLEGLQAPDGGAVRVAGLDPLRQFR